MELISAALNAAPRYFEVYDSYIFFHKIHFGSTPLLKSKSRTRQQAFQPVTLSSSPFPTNGSPSE